MDASTRTAASRWLSERRAAVVVEVTRTQGSVPREVGTRMLVDAREVVGTIGGGHLEFKATERARELLAGGAGSPRSEHFALGPSLGQCCGGAVTLAYRRLDAALMSDWPLREPLFALQLYGAGHVGRAIATLLATLDCRVDWIDERESAWPACTTLGTPWPDHIRRTCVDAVEGEVDHAASGAFYLVLTHSHELDLRITRAILQRADFGYLGVIGSRTKRQRFVHRFEQLGVPTAALSRMRCPIGVAHIDAKAPEIVALAVVAELLQQVAPHGSTDGANCHSGGVLATAAT